MHCSSRHRIRAKQGGGGQILHIGLCRGGGWRSAKCMLNLSFDSKVVWTAREWYPAGSYWPHRICLMMRHGVLGSGQGKDQTPPQSTERELQFAKRGRSACQICRSLL